MSTHMATTIVRVHPDSGDVTVNATLGNIYLKDQQRSERQWFATHALDNVVAGQSTTFSSQQDTWNTVRPSLVQAVDQDISHFSVIVAGIRHSGKSHTLFG